KRLSLSRPVSRTPPGWIASYVRESAEELHRPGPAPRAAGSAARPGLQPAVVLGRRHPRPVPLARPRGVGGGESRPRPPAGHGPAGPSRGHGAGPGLPLLHERDPRRAPAVRRGRPVVPDPQLAAAVGGLLLARVRHHRGAATVLRRPRRPRRRPPEGGQRPRHPPRRGLPLLPAGLLPP